MPSIEKRPILHATDVKFDGCKGFNVLCVEPHIDLRRNFDVTFSQTTNITSFMSVRAKHFHLLLHVGCHLVVIFEILDG